MRWARLGWGLPLAALLIVPAGGCSTTIAVEDDGGVTDDGGGGGGDVADVRPTDGGGLDVEAEASGPEPCSTEGAVRVCTTTGGSKGAQTCVAMGNGDVWGTCYGLDCSDAKAMAGETCVPAGSFMMGGLPAETDTSPSHLVTIRRRFYIEQQEVSYGEFETWWNMQHPVPKDGTTVFIAGDGSKVTWSLGMGLQTPGTDQGSGCMDGMSNKQSNFPMTCVGWETALAYCLSVGKRLPTEAEWEYVATGVGAGNDYPWGDMPSPDCQHAIYQGCTWPQVLGSDPTGDTTTKVNALSGDVAEWVLDTYPPQCAAHSDCWPTVPDDPLQTVASNGLYVVRGGSWVDGPNRLYSRARNSQLDANYTTAGGVGFRCVRDER